MSRRDPLAPRSPDGMGRGLMLALLVHVLLVVGLAIGVNWRTSNPQGVQAELWAAVPQVAAPRAAAPEPAPQPAPEPPPPPSPPAKKAPPPPPPPPPEPEPAPPPKKALPDPQIAIEKARREEREREQERQRQENLKKLAAKKLEQEKAAAEKLAREKAARDKAEAEKLAREKAEAEMLAREKAQVQKLAREKAEAEKAAALEKEKKRKEEELRQAKLAEAKEKAEAKRIAEQREEAVRRMLSQAGGSTGEVGSKGTEAQNAAPSDSYAGRVKARIKPNIVFVDQLSSNPQAEVLVKLAPDGRIISQRLVRSSGSKEWDAAVERAIDRTEMLPRDTDGRVPATMLITFRPRE